MQKKKLGRFVLSSFFILTSAGVASTRGEIKTLRVTVNELAGEIDLKDNAIEKEVNIISQGFIDLAATSMSISPLYIVESDTVTVSVPF